MSFRKPEVRTGFAGKSRKTRENAWFSQRCEKYEEKRAEANVKNEKSQARSEKLEKRVKTNGFRQVFEERARENDEKTGAEARPRGPKNV